MPFIHSHKWWPEYLFFILLIIFSIGQKTTAQPANIPVPNISDSMLRHHVNALAHDSMMGRMSGTPEIEKAAAYIETYMRQIGLEPLDKKKGTYLIPVSIRINKATEHNVIGIVPGKVYPDSTIIFSAHYDHIGITSKQVAGGFGQAPKIVKGDTTFNGANDNASGVAAMLEIARFFSQIEPAYTLIFAAFWGEEFGLLGSRDFVESSGSVFIDLKKIKWNINLEMLGRPGKAKPFLVQDPDKRFQDMVPVLNANLFDASPNYGKAYFRNDPFPEEKLFKRSDNFSFHEKKIPSFTFMAGVLPDKFYHAVIDEAATIDFSAMTQIVQAITLAVTPLIFKNSLL